MPWVTPPIVPYGSTSSTSSRHNTSPSVIPLTVSFNLKLLEPYLPPPRTHFLSENPESSARSANSPLPHVTLTYAQSLDSQIALSPGKQTILSGPETKAMTHYLRTRHDALLIGAGTAVADNPGLNSRYAIFDDSSAVVGLHRQPRPFILDPHGIWKPSPEQRIFRLAEEGLGRAPWWILSKESAARMALHEETQRMLQTIGEFGGEVLELEEGKEKDWEEILSLMAGHGVRSVMVEGGGAIISSLLEKRNQRFVSDVIVTIAPTYLGQGGVVASPKRSGDANEVRLKDVSWVPMNHDVVMAGIPDLSEVLP